MYHAPLLLTEADRNRLLDALDTASRSWRNFAPCLQGLHARVLSAQVVPADGFPDGRVALGDRVQLLHARPVFRETVRLVLPGHPAGQSPLDNALSVFSPLGAALLGAAVGTSIYWFLDDRPRHALIEHIHRPTITPALALSHPTASEPAAPDCSPRSVA